MSPTNDGGTAFPVIPPCTVDGSMASGYPYPEAGMSLRDYAAIKFAAAWVPVLGMTVMDETREQRAAECARLGLLQADAMLAERSKVAP